MRFIPVLLTGLVVAGCHASPPPAADPLTVLIDSLQSQTGHARWETVNRLGELGDRRALGALARVAATEPEAHARWRALWALSRVGTVEEITVALRPYLASESSEHQYHAALALAFFGAADGLPIVHAHVLDPDPFRRFEAINALGRVHDESSIGLLGTALKSPSVKDRNEVVLALGRIGGEPARRLLLSALMDESEAVRWRAAMALSRAGTSADLRALQIVADTDISEDVREHARRAILRIRQRETATQ